MKEEYVEVAKKFRQFCEENSILELCGDTFKGCRLPLQVIIKVTA